MAWLQKQVIARSVMARVGELGEVGELGVDSIGGSGFLPRHGIQANRQ
jgi:hypothetical protein